jgi:hypothetical protein
VGKGEGRRPLRRSRRRLEDNIKMDLREVKWTGGGSRTHKFRYRIGHEDTERE